MTIEAYRLIKRRYHVARQRALASEEPQMQRDFEKAKRERDRAYFARVGGFAVAS